MKSIRKLVHVHSGNFDSVGEFSDCRMIREACNHSQIKLFWWFTRIIQSDTTLISRN
ncbi:hypothetical protein HanPSC8_Chr03g0127461 [Helianthus annuus]|nr:hypothetical protein HanPSC8_Chr03g0127461 [Helianthus annuus]